MYGRAHNYHRLLPSPMSPCNRGLQWHQSMESIANRFEASRRSPTLTML